MGFRSQEISQEEKVKISEYFQGFGWLAFKENAFDLKDVPKEPARRDTESPAKRLRAVLFVLYKQNKSEEPFEAFYDKQMEGLIETIKGLLE